MSKPRVLCAMSGGVDSSVAAYLLKSAGYDVVGMTMKTWSADGGSANRSCCGIDDVDDARRIAAQLDIPYIALDMEDIFQKTVIQDFQSEYLKGRTPNPCIVCNYKLKFGYLLQKADEVEAEYVATGHYARIVEKDGRLAVLSCDHEKDQSYVLYNLSQAQLARIMFPLADFDKDKIRDMAWEQKLTRVAAKPDSVEICFVKDDYRNFLKTTVNEKLQPGEFIGNDGQVLGKNEGVAMYTVGQRKGLGINLNEKTYVTEILPEKNQVRLGRRQDLFRKEMRVNRINWMAKAPTTESFEAQVKIRYQHEPVKCFVAPQADGSLQVEFSTAQEQVAPGQSAVFYDQGIVLLGGLIDSCS